MPRILCGRFPHLGLVAAWRHHPELRAEPVAVVGAVPGAPAERVVAVSPSAAATGVRTGQPRRQAQQACPGAAIVPLDGDAVGRLRAAILTAVCAVVPTVELGDDHVYADVSGRHARHPGEASWAAAAGRALADALGEDPALGVAATRFVAWAAARESVPRRVRIVRDGEEAAFLAPLPVGLLPADPAVLARLGSLGLDCIGAVAALSPADLQRQFGPAGLSLHRTARGSGDASLDPGGAPDSVTVRLVLDGDVDDREALRRCARRAAVELGDRLRDRGLAAGALQLVLEGERGPAAETARVLPAPAGGVEELWSALLGLLVAAVPSVPVAALRLEGSRLAGASASARQADLWRRSDAARDAVAGAAARLCDRFGAASVVRPRLRLDPGDLPERRFAWEPAVPGITVVRTGAVSLAAAPGRTAAPVQGHTVRTPVTVGAGLQPSDADAPISWRSRPSTRPGGSRRGLLTG